MSSIATQNQRLATVGGFGAVLLWSTTISVVRSLSEHVGPISAGAGVFAVSGLLSLFFLFHNSQKRQQILQLPIRYIVGCGALFVGNVLVLFLAIGWAENRQQVLEVGLLNYLWPTLTLILSLILLGKKANWMLCPGTLATLFGVFLVVTQGEQVSWPSFVQNLTSNPEIYLLAFAAAISWALYSNLARRWAGGQKEGAVVLFLPLTALVLFFICGFVDEPQQWNFQTLAEMLFLGIAKYGAYTLWDNAMRKGNVVVVAATSYLAPFFSTLVSCFYLAVVPGIGLWVGCGALVFGSVMSWQSVSSGSDRRGTQAADAT